MSSNYPKSVVDAARDAVIRNPDNIPKAVTEAVRAVKKLPDYQTLIDGLVRDAVREVVYDLRHAANTTIKRSLGRYGGPGKVNGVSPGVSEVYRNVYDYHIAGKTLGELKGEELAPISQSEMSQADGHLFNAALCDELSRLVPAGFKVRDKVTEKKLAGIFRRLQENGYNGPAV